jgi:hypothetical protein
MKRHIFCGLAILLFCFSCKKTDHSVLVQANDFPVTIGSWWMYQVFDVNNNIQDTLTYTVLDVVSIGGFSWQRWISVESTYYDTTYVLSSANSIGFYKYEDTSFVNFKINFPVVDNEPWTTPVQGVSYTTNMQNITVNGTTYNNVAYLNRYAPYMQGYSVNESIWIARGIGIVRHTNLLAGHYTDEHLIAYKIM